MHCKIGLSYGDYPVSDHVSSPGSSGRSKSVNGKLKEGTRRMWLSAPNLLMDMWAEAVNTSCLIRNLFLVPSGKENQTPFELIHDRNPYIGLFHKFKFGCKAFVYQSAEKGNRKLDSRCELEILGGCCEGDAYRVLLSDRNTVVETMNVTFDGR